MGKTSTAILSASALANKKATGSTTKSSSSSVAPRPSYPSFWTILGHFLHLFVFHQGLVGAWLVHYGAPLYLWTRKWAREFEIGNAFFFAMTISILHTSLFVGVNLPYFLMDRYRIFSASKLYRKPSMQPKQNPLTGLAMDQLVSQLLVGPLVSYFGYKLIFQHRLAGFDTTIPSFGESFAFLMFCYIVNDVLFYFLHRLLHSKVLYKRFHKRHHEFVASVGYAAEYAHPVEGVLCNQLPVVAGALLWNDCHPWCFFVYLAIRLQETYETHSGYILNREHWWGWLWGKHYQTAFHDFHHTHNRGNFGVFWLDWWFGTMDHYQALNGYEGYLELSSNKKR